MLNTIITDCNKYLVNSNSDNRPNENYVNFKTQDIKVIRTSTKSNKNNICNNILKTENCIPTNEALKDYPTVKRVNGYYGVFYNNDQVEESEQQENENGSNKVTQRCHLNSNEGSSTDHIHRNLDISLGMFSISSPNLR